MGLPSEAEAPRRFRTIQVYPKELLAHLRQVERAVEPC
jgi:hypothetical protein